MSRYASPLLALALAGTLLTAAPSFAAPPTGNGSNGPSGNNSQLNCADPNVHNPACPPSKFTHKGKPGSNSGNTSQGPGANNNSQNNNNNNNNNNKGPGKGPSMGGNNSSNGPNNSMQNGKNGHPPFSAFVHQYHFPSFGRPSFSVRPGIVVPRAFGLRPLPPELFWYYPQYRGYLYFVAPNGDIVIVSARSYRIIAVLPG